MSQEEPPKPEDYGKTRRLNADELAAEMAKYQEGFGGAITRRVVLEGTEGSAQGTAPQKTEEEIKADLEGITDIDGYIKYIESLGTIPSKSDKPHTSESIKRGLNEVLDKIENSSEETDILFTPGGRNYSYLAAPSFGGLRDKWKELINSKLDEKLTKIKSLELTMDDKFDRCRDIAEFVQLLRKNEKYYVSRDGKVETINQEVVLQYVSHAEREAAYFVGKTDSELYKAIISAISELMPLEMNIRKNFRRLYKI
jgi:hypothetical protein